VKHEDLLPWQKSIDGILEGLYAAQNDRKCVVIVDEEGGKGKSMLARYMAQNPCHAVVQGGKRDNIAYVLYQMMNPDPIPGLKRDQQPIGKEPKRLIIDIARQEGSTQDIIAYSAAEQVLNGHFFSQKYKCGSGLLTKEFCQVLIMTNYEPDFKQLSADRWLVYTVKPDTMELQLRENYLPGFRQLHTQDCGSGPRGARKGDPRGHKGIRSSGIPKETQAGLKNQQYFFLLYSP